MQVRPGQRRAFIADSATGHRFADDVAEQGRAAALGMQYVIGLGDRIEAPVENLLGFGKIGRAGEAEISHPTHHREDVLRAMIELGEEERPQLLIVDTLVDSPDLGADRPRRQQQMLLGLARIPREEFEHRDTAAAAVDGKGKRGVEAKAPAEKMSSSLTFESHNGRPPSRTRPGKPTPGSKRIDSVALTSAGARLRALLLHTVDCRKR